MAIMKISADEAVRNRKNEFGAWGRRGEANRVEPIARPGFKVPFSLVPGESIFTIGSCFARNVENALVDRGFDIPARDLFTLPEFKDVHLSVLNNFGVPSIANELA